MTNIIRASDPDFDSFDPVYLEFVANTVCYPDTNKYMFIVTGECRVVHVTETTLWLSVNSELATLLNMIDIRHIEHRCKDKSDYLNLIDNYFPSLKMSMSGQTDLLKVSLRPNTEIYGNISDGATVQAAISANYNNRQILWNAAKIKCIGVQSTRNESQEPVPEFLQECQLEQTLIKI